MYQILFMVRHREISDVQISKVEARNCQMFFAQRQLNTSITIAVTGTAYIKQSQILGVFGVRSNKNTKTVVATSHTRPAERRVINRCLDDFFVVCLGDVFDVKSFSVILKISHIFLSVTMSGRDSPFSHFETDLSEKFNFSPSSAWVNFASFLCFKIFSAIIFSNVPIFKKYHIYA